MLLVAVVQMDVIRWYQRMKCAWGRELQSQLKLRHAGFVGLVGVFVVLLYIVSL